MLVILITIFLGVTVGVFSAMYCWHNCC